MTRVEEGVAYYLATTLDSNLHLDPLFPTESIEAIWIYLIDCNIYQFSFYIISMGHMDGYSKHRWEKIN